MGEYLHLYGKETMVVVPLTECFLEYDIGQEIKDTSSGSGAKEASRETEKVRPEGRPVPASKTVRSRQGKAGYRKLQQESGKVIRGSVEVHREDDRAPKVSGAVHYSSEGDG